MDSTPESRAAARASLSGSMLIGVTCIILAALVSWFAYFFARGQLESVWRYSESTIGMIAKVDMGTTCGSGGGKQSRDGTFYVPTIEYRTPDGSNVFIPGTPVCSSYGRSVVVGQQVEVRFDPENPTKGVQASSLSLVPVIIVIFIALALWAVGIWQIAMRMRSGRRK